MAGRQGINLQGPNSTDRARMVLESHYAWKGDAAAPQTKRDRARRRYSLGPCELCGKRGTDRHHKDGDTGHNTPDNIQILCRRCHMEIDGRLASFVATGGIKPQPPKPCCNCGRLAKPLRNGRCCACDIFFRRIGREWTPTDANGKPRRTVAIDYENRKAKAILSGEIDYSAADIECGK